MARHPSSLAERRERKASRIPVRDVGRCGSLREVRPGLPRGVDRVVRPERALVYRVEEHLKAAGLAPLDWYHLPNEVEHTPKGMLRSPMCRTAHS
jgi:hypothetical protein